MRTAAAPDASARPTDAKRAIRKRLRVRPGGAYWEKDNATAQKTYNEFNPIKLINNWNTPILIIQGGKDYRVPIGQGQKAFQAAQLKGIKVNSYCSQMKTIGY